MSVLHEVKFRIDREDRSKSFLELDGQRLKFLTLKVESDGSSGLPFVTIGLYARAVEGEIMGAQGVIKLIHIDESTKPPQADSTGGCPAGVKIDDK